LTAYIGLIRKEPESCYGVDFPDFPVCITSSGKILAAAFTKNAARVDAVPYLLLNKRNLNFKYVLPST